MSIITSSIIINSSNLNTYKWPITIKPPLGSTGATITFTSNVTFTKNTYYFIIGGSTISPPQITITGSNQNNNLQNLITISTNLPVSANYPGLVQNGSVSQIISDNAKNNVTIQYLAITSSTTTIDPCAGWFTSSNYGLNLPQPNNLLIQYCESAGQMNNSFSGGIVGASSTARVFNSTSKCTLNNAGQGGIFGAYSTGIADTCKSNCPTGSKSGYAGGIFGYKSGGTAINCVYSPTGIQQLPSYSGGIYGKSANNANIINCVSSSNYTISNSGCGGIVGSNASNCIIIGCTNNGLINGQNSGGIVGVSASNCTITRCTNTGAINAQGQGSGGICGGYANNETINNCVNANNNANSNIIGLGSGGIIGQNSKGCTTNSCTNLRNIKGTQIGGIIGRIATSNVNNGVTATGKVQSVSILSGQVLSGAKFS
jgi:hypothetical protein